MDSSCIKDLIHLDSDFAVIGLYKSDDNRDQLQISLLRLLLLQQVLHSQPT